MLEAGLRTRMAQLDQSDGGGGPGAIFLAGDTGAVVVAAASVEMDRGALKN